MGTTAGGSGEDGCRPLMHETGVPRTPNSAAPLPRHETDTEEAGHPSPTRRVNRSIILRAGLAMADDHGLPSVSMRSVAARLGVAPMTLYRHVPDKASLLDGLIELVLSEIVHTPVALSRDPIGHLLRAVRASGRAHPDVFGLLVERSRSTPMAAALRDAFRTALLWRGVPRSKTFLMEEVISTVITGAVAAEGRGWSDGFADPSDVRVFAAVEHMIHRFIDEHRAPGAGGTS